ncbi:glutaminase [Ureibacillus sinduriensis]|uniref:glutaminase n=1 Tax=Ureibacillus sinduriensis TaxID=561440 RepID=UPI000A6714F4
MFSFGTIQNGKIEHLEGTIGIGLFSSMIDKVGNSAATMHFLESLSEQYQLSVF